METLELLPNRLRIRVGVGRAVPQFGQAFDVLFVVDAFIQFAHALLLGACGGRAQPMPRRMPGLVRQPVLAHGRGIVGIIGGETSGAMLAPGVVGPHRKERAGSKDRSYEAATAQTLLTLIAQTALECGGRWRSRIATAERRDAALQQRQIVAWQIPQVVQARLIQRLQRVGQPDQRFGQSHRLGCERDRRDAGPTGWDGMTETAHGEQAMLRTVQFQRVPRHTKMAIDLFLDRFAADRIQRGAFREEIRLGENQGHRTRRRGRRLGHQIILDDLLDFLLGLQAGGGRIGHGHIETQPDGIAIAEKIADRLLTAQCDVLALVILEKQVEAAILVIQVEAQLRLAERRRQRLTGFELEHLIG